MGGVDGKLYGDALRLKFDDIHRLIKIAVGNENAGIISIVIRDTKAGCVDIIHNIKSNENKGIIKILEASIKTLKNQEYQKQK